MNLVSATDKRQTNMTALNLALLAAIEPTDDAGVILTAIENATGASVQVDMAADFDIDMSFWELLERKGYQCAVTVDPVTALAQVHVSW